MTFWRKLLGIPEKEDITNQEKCCVFKVPISSGDSGVFAVPISIEKMKEYGWDIGREDISLDINYERIVITKKYKLKTKEL